MVYIPKKRKEYIKITPVKIVDDVLKIALTKELKRVEWVEVDNLSKSKDKNEKVETHLPLRAISMEQNKEVRKYVNDIFGIAYFPGEDGTTVYWSFKLPLIP